MKKGVRVFVAPEFKTMIKIESAKRDMTIIDYTRSLARSKSLIEEESEAPLIDKINDRRKGFGFRV